MFDYDCVFIFDYENCLRTLLRDQVTVVHRDVTRMISKEPYVSRVTRVGNLKTRGWYLWKPIQSSARLGDGIYGTYPALYLELL